MAKVVPQSMRDRFYGATRALGPIKATNQDSESEPESSVDAPGTSEQEERRRVVAESVEPEARSSQTLQHRDRVEDSEPPEQRTLAEAEAQGDQRQTSEAEEEVDEATLDAWAAFSDEYHDMVEQLPLEVQRAFRLISEMESDTNKSLTSLQNALNVYVAAAKDHGAASHVPELQNVVHFLVQSTRNAGDRFSLASTLYETVDRHIQRLDADLTRLLEPQDGLQDDSLQTDDLETVESDEEAESSLTAATHPHSRTIIKIKPSNKSATVSNTFTNHAAASNGTKRKLKKTSASSQKKKRKNAAGDGSYRQPSASLLASLDEIPATPDEPRYCYCNNVAMGDVCCKDLPRKPKLQADGLIPQMVGCDNEDCPREWFHLECVGMEEAPEGEWFCRPCAAARGAGLLTKAVDEGQIQDQLAQQQDAKRSQMKSTAASGDQTGEQKKSR